MAATKQLWRGVTRYLVMSGTGGNRGGGQFMGVQVHGIHRRLFSSGGHGGTPAGGLEAPNNYNKDYNYKPPQHYNEDLHRHNYNEYYNYKPPQHYNEDLHHNNPSHGFSSRDRYFKNISEKCSPIKMEYEFEKLEYRIFNMERSLHALQISMDEIRNEIKKIKKAVLHINTEKLSNDNVCAKHVAAKSKAAVLVSAESVAESKGAVAKPKESKVASAVDDGCAVVIMIAMFSIVWYLFISWMEYRYK